MASTLGIHLDATSLAEALARLCEDPHVDGDGWRARCPNHAGKSDTSFSITPKDDRVLLNCFGGCATIDIVHAIGLTMADLFVKKAAQTNGYERIVDEYDYFDAHGTLIHQTIRYSPKRFTQRRPDPVKPGKWIWNLKTIQIVLYNLPTVMQAIEAGTTIYVCEGEKDANTLTAHGLVATTCPMGAGKWQQTYTEALRKAHVVILPHNDTPGQKHAEQVARALLGTAATVKIVPGLHTGASGSDISDWLQAGGTYEAFAASVNATPLYQLSSHDQASPASLAEVDALIESLRFPFISTGPNIPALPQRARQETPTWTTWLDDYAAHSAYWAPRAAPAYHQAVGLWVLSTIAARRIMVQMGSTAVYPTLFLALVSESTHWTKTTAASIGIRLLRRAGCGHLLAPDRTTPQFLLKLMSGLVPRNYGTLDEEDRSRARDVLGFSAQRGWFYEEWGGMLHQMRRVDSPHAELNKLLIVLEGGAETFETGTIQRGLERINNPYLALLGNATPHDLAPFMGEGNPWWHDGFWPRFVCVAPPYDATPSRAPRPREAYSLPSDLIMQMNEWHRRLGTPSVTVTEERESNGKLTGAWVGTIGTLPCQALTLAPDVYDAYETYNDVLLAMVHAGDIPSDLSPWYGRAHEKALRVAMLLASVHGETTITLPYWSKGQAMAETWRRSLHETITTMAETAPLSREAQLEAKIESLCTKTGGMTARELQQNIKGSSSDVMQKALTAMVKSGILMQSKAGKTTIYSPLPDEYGEGGE